MITWTLFGAPMKDGERKGTDLKFRIQGHKVVPYFMKIDGQDKTVLPVHAVFIETDKGDVNVQRQGKNGSYNVKGILVDFDDIMTDDFLEKVVQELDVNTNKKSIALVNLFTDNNGNIMFRAYKPFYAGELQFVVDTLKTIQIIQPSVAFNGLPQLDSGDWLVFNTTGNFFPAGADGIGIFSIKVYGTEEQFPKTHIIVGFHYAGTNTYLSISEHEAFYMNHLIKYGGKSQTLYRDQSKGGYSDIVRQFFVETDPSRNYISFTMREKKEGNASVYQMGEVKGTQFIDAIKNAIAHAVAWQGYVFMQKAQK